MTKEHKENLIEVLNENEDRWIPILSCVHSENIKKYYLFEKIKIWQRKQKETISPNQYQLITSFKLLNLAILTIRYDGLNDIYYLFDKYKLLTRENDRAFWNNWE